MTLIFLNKSTLICDFVLIGFTKGEMKIEALTQIPVCKGRGVAVVVWVINILWQQGVEELGCLVSCYTKCQDKWENMSKY